MPGAMKAAIVKCDILRFRHGETVLPAQSSSDGMLASSSPIMPLRATAADNDIRRERRPVASCALHSVSLSSRGKQQRRPAHAEVQRAFCRSSDGGFRS